MRDKLNTLTIGPSMDDFPVIPQISFLSILIWLLFNFVINSLLCCADSLSAFEPNPFLHKDYTLKYLAGALG